LGGFDCRSTWKCCITYWLFQPCGDHLITLQLLSFQFNIIVLLMFTSHTLQLVFLQKSSAFSCTEKYSGQLYTKGLNDSCSGNLGYQLFRKSWR
jgi:hypothetical protein